jgi:hypothetical protein
MSHVFIVRVHSLAHSLILTFSLSISKWHEFVHYEQHRLKTRHSDKEFEVDSLMDKASVKLNNVSFCTL